MTTTHPEFSWALPSGETALSISVARSSTINPSTDDFMPGELAQIGMLKGDATKWTPSRPLPAGKYYWHVASRAGAQNRVYSAVSSFVIRPLISKLSISAKSSYGRMFLITTSWTANEQKVDFLCTALSREQAARRAQADDGQLPHRLPQAGPLDVGPAGDGQEGRPPALRRHPQERGRSEGLEDDRPPGALVDEYEPLAFPYAGAGAAARG